MSTTRIQLSKLVDILGLWLANKVTFLDLVKVLKILSKRRTHLISGHWPQSLMVSANWRTDCTYLLVHISYNFVFCILISSFPSSSFLFRPETVNTNGGFTFNANWPGVWVQIVSSWLCLALYVWTLIAPIACPNRQFSFAGGEA